MKFKMYSQEEKARLWALKKPGELKWFAWYPVEIDGYCYWLTFVYRYRFVGYRLRHGYIKDYLYESSPGKRAIWATKYYGRLKHAQA